MEFMTREEAQAENFSKMLLAMSEDVRVILIKFADRLHNMRTLQHLPENKQQQDRRGNTRNLCTDSEQARYRMVEEQILKI